LEQSDSLVEPEAFVAAKQTIIKSMESRQIAISTARAIAGTLESEIASQSTFAATLMQEFQALESQQSITKQSLQQAEQGVQEMQNLIQKGIEACGHNFQKMMEDRQKGLQMSAMRSLSPEQLGLSILNSTQVFKNYVDVELAAFEKQSPLAADAAPELHGARRLQATRQAIDKLRPNLDVFANLYASGAGQTSDEFFATPDQALFMANGGAVFQWSANSGNNITSQVVMSTDASAAITNLYRAVMSRDPSPQELQWAVEQLAKADDKKLAISQELVWGLLTSSEYRVYP